MKPLCVLLFLLLARGCAARHPLSGGVEPMIDFARLRNPVHDREGWSIKDAAMLERDGVFHLFCSAFFEHEGQVRSHVVHVTTRDFRDYSEPLFLWNGMEDGWIGMCSPSVREHDGEVYLFYNSWGDKDRKPNQLFFARTTDLVKWEKHIPLAANLTAGARAIDAEGWFANGKVYVLFKQRARWEDGRLGDRTRLAVADAPHREFAYPGDGFVEFLMPDGKPNGNIHENYCLFEVDGQMHVLTTDYRPAVHAPYIYRMAGGATRDENWLRWDSGFKLAVPVERFNTNHNANAAFLADWRRRDGYFYLLYAGRTEGESFARRGDNRLGLARSTDLMHWEVPGQ